MIRTASAADLPRLQQDIERTAGAALRAHGMDAIADDPPLPLEALAAYQRDSRAWIATAERDLPGDPVAYLLADVVDGAAHVEQVFVHPVHAGRRLGSALLDEASRWAADRHFTSVTLTTFTQVPWNGPYYARLRFR